MKYYLIAKGYCRLFVSNFNNFISTNHVSKSSSNEFLVNKQIEHLCEIGSNQVGEVSANYSQFIQQILWGYAPNDYRIRPANVSIWYL